MPPIFCQRLVLFTFETWGGEDEVSDVRFQVPKWDPVHCWIHTFSQHSQNWTMVQSVVLPQLDPQSIRWLLVCLQFFDGSNHFRFKNPTTDLSPTPAIPPATATCSTPWRAPRIAPGLMVRGKSRMPCYISPWNAAMYPWHFIYIIYAILGYKPPLWLIVFCSLYGRSQSTSCRKTQDHGCVCLMEIQPPNGH